MNQPPRAVFLDRDGTLIEHVPYLCDPAAVVIRPGTREALARLQAAAVKLFLFTNQSGVARGFFGMAEVDAVNRRMVELLDWVRQRSGQFRGAMLGIATGHRGPAPTG
jgi:D-glycero-D-manno-heptose 1,7-bisphosphate phosphatase